MIDVRHHVIEEGHDVPALELCLDRGKVPDLRNEAVQIRLFHVCENLGLDLVSVLVEHQDCVHLLATIRRQEKGKTGEIDTRFVRVSQQKIARYPDAMQTRYLLTVSTLSSSLARFAFANLMYFGTPPPTA